MVALGPHQRQITEAVVAAVQARLARLEREVLEATVAMEPRQVFPARP